MDGTLDKFFEEFNEKEQMDSEGVRYLPPYETASNIPDVLQEEVEEEGEVINADGTIDVEVEIPEEIYTDKYINDLLNDVDEVAFFRGLLRRAGRGRTIFGRFRVSPAKEKEFIKKAAKYGLTIVRPKGMRFEPPKDTLLTLWRKYGRPATTVSVYLHGHVHPGHLEEIAKKFGLKITDIKHIKVRNRIISSARVVGAISGIGARLFERMMKLAHYLGACDIPLTKGVKLIATKI